MSSPNLFFDGLQQLTVILSIILQVWVLLELSLLHLLSILVFYSKLMEHLL